MIECIPTPDQIDACLSCGAQNYAMNPLRATDVAIFRLKVSTPGQRQTWAWSLCARCLQEVAQVIHPHRSGT